MLLSEGLPIVEAEEHNFEATEARSVREELHVDTEGYIFVWDAHHALCGVHAHQPRLRPQPHLEPPYWLIIDGGTARLHGTGIAAIARGEDAIAGCTHASIDDDRAAESGGRSRSGRVFSRVGPSFHRPCALLDFLREHDAAVDEPLGVRSHTHGSDDEIDFYAATIAEACLEIASIILLMPALLHFNKFCAERDIE